jgi:hypothetical protein
MIELMCVAMLDVTRIFEVHLTREQVGDAANFDFWAFHVIRPLELAGRLALPDDQLRLAKPRHKHLPTRGAL